MGLFISANTTGETISWSYSTLHRSVRFLALKICGMPDFIDRDKVKTGFDFYMHPFIYNFNPDTDKLKVFNYSLIRAGYYYPNVMLHSDCSGSYTSNSSPGLDGALETGDSTLLMEELENILSCKEDKDDEDEFLKSAFDLTQELYDLVRKEVEEGKGTIYFD